MQGIIQKAQDSKSGKTLGVQIAGQWYQTKHFELRNMVGQEITFNASPGKPPFENITWLNDYTITGQAGNAADAAFQAAYAQHQAPQSAPPQENTPTISRDASIVAQALTKSCTGPGDEPQKVWERYKYFYGKATNWDGETSPVSHNQSDDYDDEIPFN